MTKSYINYAQIIFRIFLAFPSLVGGGRGGGGWKGWGGHIVWILENLHIHMYNQFCRGRHSIQIYYVGMYLCIYISKYWLLNALSFKRGEMYKMHIKSSIIHVIKRMFSFDYCLFSTFFHSESKLQHKKRGEKIVIWIKRCFSLFFFVIFGWFWSILPLPLLDLKLYFRL